MSTPNVHIPTALVSALTLGSEEAFKSIFDLLGTKVLNYCKKLTGSMEDAEELLQDIFVKIWQYREKIDVSANFEIFLFTVARNHLLNFARKKAAYHLIHQGVAEYHMEPAEEDQYAFDLDEIYTWYRATLQKLGPKSRQVFELSRERGLSNKEIAEKMGISVRTVETHISNALTVMRHELKDAYVVLVLFLFR